MFRHLCNISYISIIFGVRLIQGDQVGVIGIETGKNGGPGGLAAGHCAASVFTNTRSISLHLKYLGKRIGESGLGSGPRQCKGRCH